jgi:hypothetical protein
MFDLEKSIADWRRQMLAAGIKTPVPLEELENHLRDEFEEWKRSGLTEQTAFETCIRQMGGAGILNAEFAKVKETIHERLKRLFCVLAGIPNYQLATNMNTSNQNLEPGWATYLKSAAFIIPAVFIWIGSCIFVVPKLKEICLVSGTSFPKPVLAALALTDFLKNNLIPGTVAILAALILLEWRSGWWQRCRRAIFGMAAFFLNLTALIMITVMMVFAVIAAANLLHAK